MLQLKLCTVAAIHSKLSSYLQYSYQFRTVIQILLLPSLWWDIEAAPTEMEYSELHEAHWRSLKTSMIKVGTVWLFTFVAIFAARSLEIPLYFVSLADVKMRIRILGIIYTVLKDLRMQVQISGIVYTVVLQSVNKVHWAFGSAVVFIIGAVMYYYSSQNKQSRGVLSVVQKNTIGETPIEMKKENDERSLKTSMIKVGSVWLFTIVAIFAAGSLEIPLYFVSLADVKTRIRILGIVYTVLKDLRVQVRIQGIVYTVVLQSVVHWAFGSAVVFIIGAVMYYYYSQNKQNRGVLSAVQENIIGETPIEMEKENDAVVNSSFCTPSNSREASWQFRKHISLLNVKLEPEYSAGKMSSSKSIKIRNKAISENIISEVKVKLEMVFSIEERRFSEKMPPVRSLSKRLSSSRHSVLKEELSVASSSSSKKVNYICYFRI